MTFIGTVVGFIGIYLTLQSELPVEQLFTPLIIFLICLTTLSFVLFLVFLGKFIIHRRYTKGHLSITKALSIANDLRDSEEINQLEKCIEKMQESCTYIADAYTLFKNKRICVCIKLVINTGDGDIFIRTLCRDDIARKDSRRVQPKEETVIHYINENTDFKYIFENVNKNGEKFKYYISNVLPLEDFYRNSRINADEYPPRSVIPIVKEIKRLKAWPLPYKSTITVPIIILTDNPVDKDNIAGYLCIDSDTMWIFNKKYDVNILRSIANGLYPTIKKIVNNHFEYNNNETQH